MGSLGENFNESIKKTLFLIEKNNYEKYDNIKSYKLVKTFLNNFCNLCNKYFYDASSYRVHSRIHLNIKDFCCKYNYETCSKSFRTKNQLDEHMKSVHLKVKDIECYICLKMFSRQSSFKKHLNIHLNFKPHSCELCFKAFTDKSNYNTHIKRHKLTLYLNKVD